MSIKQLRIFYLANIVATLLVAGIFELFTRLHGQILLPDSFTAMQQYMINVCFVVVILLSVFLTLRMRQIPLLIRMCTISSSAILVMLDYYVLQDTNLLYFLPLLTVAYLFVWPKD